MKLRFIVLVILVFGLCVTTAQEISPALQTQLDSLESYTSTTRQLSIEHPVTRLFPSRQEALAAVRQIYADEVPKEEAQRLSQFYIAFGFFAPGTDYIGLLLSALDYQLGGFYNSDTQEMNVLLINGGTLGDSLPLLEQITYVHEFTHALQDQHFDLNALDQSTQDNRDQSLAVTSLIEGDATVTMNIYTQALTARNPLGVTVQLLAQGLQAGALSLPPGLPDIVTEELLGEYTNGAVFVSRLRADGGWDAVDKAFQPDSLPQSTEQILHPEKYLQGEAPLPVELSTPELPPGWETIWDTAFGEFYLGHYLKTELKPAEAARAAAGWGGDRVQIYHEAADDSLAWLMRVRWDTAADADEFTSAYVDFLGKQFPDVLAQESCWTTASEALCFTNDLQSHLIADAPTLEMAQALIASQP